MGKVKQWASDTAHKKVDEILATINKVLIILMRLKQNC